jgi:hypothetical protein
LRKDTMTCTDQTPGCSGDLCKGKVETLYLLKLISGRWSIPSFQNWKEL